MIDVRGRTKRKFQIHDGTVGVSLYERETAQDALLDFFADRRRGELRGSVTTGPDGIASVTVDGKTFTAHEIVDEV